MHPNTDNYNLKLLYGLAKSQPYRQSASYVVPHAEFKISYPNVRNKFQPLATFKPRKRSAA
jgi:hypothetical protein